MKKKILSIATCLALGGFANAQVSYQLSSSTFQGVYYSSIAFADVDNDGDQDVLITGYNGSSQPISKLYTNNGSGGFTEVTGTPFVGVYTSSIAFADVDNDGDQDVLITGQNSSSQPISKLYTNNGSGSFTEVTGTPFDGVSSSSIAFADVDNDGDQDVLITGQNSSVQHVSKLYTNNGSGVFTEVTGTPFDGVSSSSIAFADVDNDGDQDVLITGYTNSGIIISKLYTNNGTGSFTEVTGTPFDGVFYSSIAFADVDNDGDQDVLITGYTNSSIIISKLYTNNGSGSFTEVTGTPFDGVYLSSIAFADVDNDGDQDVLITGYTNSGSISKLYTNDGTGSFTEVTGTPFDGVYNSSIAFADVDNDGDQDVLITGYNGSSQPISKLYTMCVHTTGAENYTGCQGDSYSVIVNGTTYNEANPTGTETLTNAGGCDSVVTINLIFNAPNTGDTTATACISFTWYGTTYTTSGTPTHTLTNVAGCDSVVTLNLTINNSSTGVENYTGCQGDGYSVTVNGTTYNEANPTGTETLTNAGGCDSVVAINLIFNAPNTGDTTATACNSFTWYGTTYTTSGTPTHTLTNVAGCDSVVTLNLTIMNVSNTNVTVNDPTLTADIPFVPGVSLQWLRCPHYTPVLNTISTSPSFTPTMNGEYAVRIVENGCVDTSACVTINSVSIEENNISFSIHPNPTNGEVNIVSDFAVSNVEIFSATGRKVMESKATTLNISKVQSGVYFVKVHTEQGASTQRIIKE